MGINKKETRKRATKVGSASTRPVGEAMRVGRKARVLAWLEKYSTPGIFVGTAILAIVAIVATTCSVWVSWHTVKAITKPSPPDLYVNFALTGKPSLAVARNRRESMANFPLDLVVTNKGQLTAHNVRLKLLDSRIEQSSYHSRLVIKANETNVAQNSIYVEESARTMTTILLGEIHPGESIPLDSVLQAELATNHAPILMPFEPDANSFSMPPIPLKHHRVKAWISADDLLERELPLYITVGMIEQLKQVEDKVYVAEGGRLIISHK
ncbi:MAG: hypothetical protein JXN61_08130 [Sedimentisphaerales bacterium]|nr:hypothetical protein [Sedimentisphaerales bacterium]